VHDDPELREAFAALTQFFIGAQTLDETLLRVAEMSNRAVPAAAFVGITLMSGGRPQTTVFTDPVAPEIDAAQYDTGEGPCLHAFRTGNVVPVDSTRVDARWPAFSAACVEHEIFSTLSIPLTVDTVTHGALNLYSTTEQAFDAEQAETAALFGAQAAIVLANAVAYWGARAHAEQLEQALNSRGPDRAGQGDHHGDGTVRARRRLRPPGPAVAARAAQGPGDLRGPGPPVPQLRSRRGGVTPPVAGGYLRDTVAT
jgi:GAF domain-containing protein